MSLVTKLRLFRPPKLIFKPDSSDKCFFIHNVIKASEEEAIEYMMSEGFLYKHAFQGYRDYLAVKCLCFKRRRKILLIASDYDLSILILKLPIDPIHLIHTFLEIPLIISLTYEHQANGTHMDNALNKILFELSYPHSFTIPSINH